MQGYNFDKLVVLQNEDEETIKSISNFKDIRIYKQKNKGYGNALKEGLNQINMNFFVLSMQMDLWIQNIWMKC